MSQLTEQIKKRKNASFDYLKQKRLDWDKAEELFFGRLNDAVSQKAKSQIFDPKLSTLILERSYRVMAKLPTGKIKAISKNDLSSSKLMNLILDKYVLPNANAQFDFLTKMRLVDLYSNIYGSFFTLVDWDVKPNGYVGPDVWLLSMRDSFPQVGAIGDDMEHFIARTWKPLSYFEGLAGKSGYKNISQIISKLEKISGDKQNRDSNETTKREDNKYPDEEPVSGDGLFAVYSQFEGDRWVDMVAAADLEFRDIKNPHDNGELPIVKKYSIPTLDDPLGFSDTERGGSMQQAINANWNLYFDGLRKLIDPIVLINKDNIASMSSLQPNANAQWLVRNNLENSVKPLITNPQAIAGFNNTHQVANSSLLNLFGTSDTAVSAQIDPGMGKTPQALQMQAQRENTRDVADRFYMEKYLEKVMKKMANLISKKQSSAVTIRMFADELEELKRDNPDIEELYDENTGKLTINKSKTGSTLYDYEITPGSTYATDEESEQQNLKFFLQLYVSAQTPQGNWLEAKLQQDGYNFKVSELIKQLISQSSINQWQKILEEQTNQEKGDLIVDQTANQFAQVLQQMGGQPNVAQVPPVPNQMTGQPPMMPNPSPMPQGGMVR